MDLTFPFCVIYLYILKGERMKNKEIGVFALFLLAMITVAFMVLPTTAKGETIAEFIATRQVEYGTLEEQEAEVQEIVERYDEPTPAEPITVTADMPEAINFDELSIFDKLPSYVRDMTKKEFQQWAKAQNEMGYFMAKERAAKQQFGTAVTTIETREQGGWRSWFYRNWDLGGLWGDTTTTTTERMWTPPQWGGGPVVIINPYVDHR